MPRLAKSNQFSSRIRIDICGVGFFVGLESSSSSSSSSSPGFFVGGETGLRVRIVGSFTGAFVGDVTGGSAVGSAMGLSVSGFLVGAAVGFPGPGEGKGVPSLASQRSGRGGTRSDCLCGRPRKREIERNGEHVRI